jgi:DNA end-binding protein Ku
VEATQTVEIGSFVNAEEIPATYFETPYYLAPDRRGEKGYALLRETLKKTNKVALATVVIRTRQYVCALIPRGEIIVLNTLRYADELKSAKDLELPSGNLKTVGVTAREIEMAAKLVEEMTEDWNPEKFQDTYHADLMKLIEKRIRAGQTEVISEPEEQDESRAPAEVIDLMALLKKSVQAKEHKPGQTNRNKRIARRRPEHTARRKSA